MRSAREAASRSQPELEKLLSTWNVELPVLRDLDACGRDVFQIPGMPTLILLDATGTVQVFEVGANAHLAEQLPVVLGRLLQGENVAADILAQQRREEEAYARAIERAEKADLDSAPDTAVLAPRSEPQRLRMEKVWACSDISEPGNILVVHDPGTSPSILVVEGREAVAELDADGTRIGRRKFASPEAPVEYLRTAVDGHGERFYASAALQGPLVKVFDHLWQPVGSYPPADYRHSGIADCQLSDLDGNGELELLVGFRGTAGIHAASLRGTQRWVSHALPNVFSLLLAGGDARESMRLLATGSRGDILGMDASGGRAQSVTADERGVFHLYSADFGADRPAAFCGVTFGESGQLVALGLDGQMRKRWEHALAAGSYRSPLQFVASGRWLPAGQGVWALAGPDGTIHLLGEDGQVLDQFALGTHPRGLAVLQHQDAPHLLIATEDLVQAWRLHAD